MLPDGFRTASGRKAARRALRSGRGGRAAQTQRTTWARQKYQSKKQQIKRPGEISDEISCEISHMKFHMKFQSFRTRFRIASGCFRNRGPKCPKNHNCFRTRVGVSNRISDIDTVHQWPATRPPGCVLTTARRLFLDVGLISQRKLISKTLPPPFCFC